MDTYEKMQRKAARLSKPTPVELPSGSWRCQVTYKGRRLSVVDDDPEVAHAKVLALKNGLIRESKQTVATLTVGEAIDRYIDSKSAVLSPSTVRGYRGIRRNDLQELMPVRLNLLTQEAVQKAINAMSKRGASPKSVRNAHGLLSAALGVYCPDLMLRTTLPQKQRHEISIPSEAEICAILEAVKGTDTELPILLAVWLGLRESEIRGLTWDCISGNTLHVKQAIVRGEDGPALKYTKTYSGDRYIPLPPYILDVLSKTPHVGEYIVTMSGRAMYGRFSRLCARLGLPHYRFHDLRHLAASVMLSLGVPDKYAMERMGHATNNMLKNVYQHTMQSKRTEVDTMIDQYFSSLLGGTADRNG